MKEWRKRFAEGRTRTSLYDDPRCERPLTITNDLAEAISSVLRERLYLSCTILCQHLRIAKGTCLRILHDVPSMKSFIFVEFLMPWTRIGRLKESLYHMEFLWHYTEFIHSTGFQSVITRDESWFFLYFLCYPCDLIWASPVTSQDEMPERISQNQHRKVSNFTSLVCQ
jgi:hypothetical protein